MKKTLPKIKLPKKKEAPSGRITSNTLAEHREQVLSEGRRFKYPVQYARHKLVINAVIISVVAIVLLGVLVWWRLYPAQDTSDFMYRVSKVLALPVAKVDGETVRYGDYLMRYRSSIQYLLERDQIDMSTDDGKRQADSVKRREFDGAVADTYAAKLARELNITVTDTELEEFLIQQRQSADGEVSEATYNAVILDYYGWSPDEYRHAMKNKLLRQKVAYSVDDKAREHVETVKSLRKDGDDLKEIADKLNKDNPETVLYAPAIWVPKNNQDGGLAEVASKMKKGQISDEVHSMRNSGYYFIKLVDINDTQVRYEMIQIPLKQFDSQLEEIRKNGGVREYISVPRQEEGF